jgi:hypothetical protein
MARYRLAKPWTREEDEALILLLKGRLSLLAIAAKLRRTAGAIRTRALNLGLSTARKRRGHPE